MWFKDHLTFFGPSTLWFFQVSYSSLAGSVDHSNNFDTESVQFLNNFELPENESKDFRKVPILKSLISK